MAVAGTKSKPPRPAPSSLRPFLRFQKLPERALGPVRKVVDSDDEFRATVRVVATEDLVGRAGYLWLHRPPGWEDELVRLAEEASAEEHEHEADREERAAVRRLDAAEQALMRAQADAAAARADAEQARAELELERRARRDLEAQFERVGRRTRQLDIELGAARRKADEAEAKVAELDRDLASASSAAAELQQRAASLQWERDALTELAAATPAAEPAADLDRVGLREAFSAAAKALAAIAELVDPSAAPAGGDLAPDRQAVRAAPVRRVPIVLPGGVFEQSREAADHLVRYPGALVLVDGYNVTKLGWPDHALADQRQRLAEALDQLGARFGTTSLLVFDGADVKVAGRNRRSVRVEFSPAGVKADDVLIARIDDQPANRPVVLVTNDGAVRAAARVRGANILASEQLLDVLRR